MLETLDEVPWSKLQHAYGSAADVPRLLRALAGSGGPQQEALHELFGNIWHQGTVYEASAYAVPFLVALAAEPRLTRRDEILVLIASLALGASYLDVHANPALGLSDYFRRQPDFEQRLKQELDYVSLTRLAVYQHYAVFTRLLSDADPMVRAAAAHVLSRFPESWADFQPLLLRAAKEESHPLARVGLLWCIGTIGNKSPAALALLDAVLRENADPRQTFAAAVASHRLSGAWPLAADAIRRRMKAATWFADSLVTNASWDSAEEVDLDDLLADVEPDPPGAIQMLLQILRISDANACSFPVVHDLLHLAFQKGDWRNTIAPWNAVQQEVVRSLTSTEAAWSDAKQLWFLFQDGAKRVSELTTRDVSAVRSEMLALLAQRGGS